MANRHLTLFVEGQGDEEAIPVLIRRIAQTIDPGFTVSIAHTRTSKGKLLKEDDFVKLLERARRLAPGNGILVVMDADADCPKHIHDRLSTWKATHHADLDVGIVVAKREMESWFVAGAESLKPGLGINADAEAISDPKAYVGRRILGRFYTPTGDQASLATKLDIDMARCIQSFDKLYREVVRLLT